MKALIVYDSFFGNTERVAAEIGRTLGVHAEVRVSKAKEVEPSMLEGLDFLAVGSPTRKFRATPATMHFLKSIPHGGLRGVTAAAFDTRVDVATIKSGIFRLIVGSAGYAAKPIAKRLTRSGARLAAAPEGFIVLGTEGPLREGELERAASWARRLERTAGASGAA